MTQLSIACEHTRTEEAGSEGSRDAETLRILAAAWAVLRRSKFRSLKIRQVLTASGTSASAFYRLFPSKAHLLLALLENEVMLVDRQLRGEIDLTEPAAGQLRVWLRIMLGNIYQRNRADRTRMFLDQGLYEELPDQVRLLHQVVGSHLSGIIRRGMREGEFRAGDPETDALLVQHMVRGLLDSGLAGVLLHPEEDLVTKAHAFVLGALRNT